MTLTSWKSLVLKDDTPEKKTAFGSIEIVAPRKNVNACRLTGA